MHDEGGLWPSPVFRLEVLEAAGEHGVHDEIVAGFKRKQEVFCPAIDRLEYLPLHPAFEFVAAHPYDPRDDRLRGLDR